MSSKIINDNLIAVHQKRGTNTLKTPAYVGMCIIDLSKVRMCNFHHNYIKKKYNNKTRLLFTDTDSLTYEIETEYVHRNFWNDKERFDNGDYPDNSPYFNKTNKKVMSIFKDEDSGIPIFEFISLRSKMYSYIEDDDKDGKTAKGIMKNIIKKYVKQEDYKNIFFLITNKYIKMKTIRSNNHQLGSYGLNKVSLSCFDDKRYILDDVYINSYAYGHYKIQN